MILLDYRVVPMLGFHYLIIMLNIYEWNLILVECLVFGIFNIRLRSFWSLINIAVAGKQVGGLVLGLRLCLAGNDGSGLQLPAIIIIFLTT